MMIRFRCLLLAALAVSTTVACEDPESLGRIYYTEMTFADGRYIAAGGTFRVDSTPGFAVLATYDGAQWSVSNLGAIGALSGIAHNGRRWVAVGGQTLRFPEGDQRELVAVVVSDDGVTWRDAVYPPREQLDRVVSDGTHFVATSFLSSNVYYSEDGDYWRRIFVGDRLGSEATFAGGRYMMSHSGPTIAESFDGVNWDITTLDLGFVWTMTPYRDGAIGIGVNCLDCQPPAVETPHVVRWDALSGWSVSPAPDMPDGYDIAVGDSTLMLTADDGVYVADDDADGWQWRLAFPHTASFEDIYARGSDAFLLHFGITVSHDGGRTWEHELSTMDGLPDQ